MYSVIPFIAARNYMQLLRVLKRIVYDVPKTQGKTNFLFTYISVLLFASFFQNAGAKKFYPFLLQ